MRALRIILRTAHATLTAEIRERAAENRGFVGGRVHQQLQSVIAQLLHGAHAKNILEPCMTEIYLPLICAHYLVGGVGAGLLERLDMRPCAGHHLWACGARARVWQG